MTELSNSYRVLQPPSLVNKYAALPSLHVGWNLLIGLAVYRTGVNRAARVFGVVSPALMFAAVVLTGNHYVIDGVLGAAVAVIGLIVSLRVTPKLAVRPLVSRRPLVLVPQPVTTVRNRHRSAVPTSGKLVS